MTFLNALFTAALDNNLVFAQLIGMVSVVLVAGRPQDSFRFGAMIAVATAVAGALGWPLYTQLMQPWGVAYLAPLAYVLVSWAVIVVVATILGAGKSVAERERLLRACPIIACNAAVLAVSLGNAAAAETMTWDAALGSSIGAGLGVLLAVVLFAFVRDRIDERLVPAALRGLPITLVTASLMALAFTGVAGIAGGLFV
ncbi:Rnf-Nqr domain containing protein [Collinsella stercoris]|uniref:Rnf-Nqr domain containing protein n=1 Tax=Collinsella stercoris TaxID=147206 RepID=UPI00248DB561|nr:Rnf-Nqr domain containing protein [Collinsella stercoris]MEE0475584.1 Rnf-Nqr domain containing protein [Collinsella stercoris]